MENLLHSLQLAENRPLILVTNDDDITSKGIRTLVEAMLPLGQIVVVAPEKPQSGMGHAITLGSPLRLRKSVIFGEDVIAFECSGTPADCVKMGKHLLLRTRKPNLVVSGINHGSNASISVIYSGTMSAAIEAALEGIPAIGFSLDDFRSDADFSHTVPFLQQIAAFGLSSEFPKGTALNVNFPKKSAEQPLGIRWCKQAKAVYQEIFDARKDPHGRTYYWMDGEFEMQESYSLDSDIGAVQDNYISIVPCGFDLTNYESLDKLKNICL